MEQKRDIHQSTSRSLFQHYIVNLRRLFTLVCNLSKPNLVTPKTSLGQWREGPCVLLQNAVASTSLPASIVTIFHI